MPVYKKGKDRWRVVIAQGGRRQDFVIRGTRADALAFEARTRVGLERSGNKLAESRVAPRFCDFCVETYRAHAEMQLRASTWKIRQYHVATLVGHLGDRQLTDIDNAVIESFKRARHAEGKAARTINAELASLQAILSYARRIGVPCTKPDLLWLRTVKSKRAKPWSSEEVDRLFRAAQEDAPFLVPLLTFLVNTGCRKTEALHVTWEHIDFERGLVRIWPSDEWRPKDDEPREIPMSDTLRAMLLSLRRTSRFVFPATGGDRYACWPKRTFDRVRNLAGLTGGPHTLRHTFASHFLASQPDVFLLARLLGHADTAVTRIYSHLLPGHLDRARNAVNIAPAAMPKGLGQLGGWAGPRRGEGGRWAKRPAVRVEELPEASLPLPDFLDPESAVRPETPTAAVWGGGQVDASLPDPRRLKGPRKVTLRPELAELRRRFAEADEEAEEARKGLSEAEKSSDSGDLRRATPGQSREFAGSRLPAALPANDIGARACARAPRKVPSSRLVTGLDVLGIEPRTSRVRF
jgi:integrase